MQFTFDFIVNPIIILVTVVVAAFAGWAVNKARLVKSQQRIRQLENEMISSHAEILETQRAYVRMEARLKEQAIPVIPMKINGKETNSKETASK